MRHPLLPWIGAVLVPVLILGCGKGAPSPETELANAEWEVRVESPLDTLESAAGDTSGMMVPPPAPSQATTPAPTPEAAATAAAAGTAAAGAGQETIPPDPRQFTPGWRVQIFASSNLQLADDKAAEFRAISRQPVYVEYEPPFYKVRVGDFLVRQDADAFRADVLSNGWSGAWVAETLVLRPN